MTALSNGAEAWLARPPGAPGTGVVVLMEVFGLTPWLRSVCERFARAGYLALAPDLYHGDRFDYADRDAARARARLLDDDAAMTDVGASIDALASEGARDDGIAVIGFCMGGRLAFLANATLGHRLAASLSFYGGGIAPSTPGARRPLVDRVPDIVAPQLLIYGAKDASIAADEHGRIAQALTAANRRYTLAVIPDAGHGFAAEDRDTYAADPAAAAWRIAFAFLVDALMH
ncbi:MAG TPA: dienelactone hydrolase family protein [Casimicrobiaceae bacterium]|nr:dienelactone hydrolase family protein [Casimicrobiaceae bacterium]